MRIKLKDVTLKRVSEAIYRRFVGLPDIMAWKSDRHFKNKLKGFKNIHKGQRCFLIANGPSLKHTDVSLLKDEVTIGMNRIYVIFKENNFTTTYYSVVNELVIEQFHDDIAHLPCKKFVNWNQRNLFKNNDDINYMFISQALTDDFSADLTKNTYSGGTVTYVSLQLAYYLGFSEVILIGLDHNFVDKGTPNKTELRKGDDENHFHPDYFPKGMKWQLPDLYRSELAYAKARKEFEKDGRRILDATIGGNCEVFEKIDYYSLFPSLNSAHNSK